MTPADGPPPTHIDYLAKDYASFRQLLLDHMALAVPGWVERHAADLGITLIELLAYAADYLSYYQEAVAAEAYLSTARQRISVRRHARLLEYAIVEGCHARVWVHLETSADGVPVPEGTPLLPRIAGRAPRVPRSFFESYDDVVFETMHEAMLYVAHNRMVVDSGGVAECSLPEGGTQASLAGHFPNLAEGDVLVFEQLADPILGGHARPGRPHAVRLAKAPTLTQSASTRRPITILFWHDEDALPAAYPVAGRLPDGRLWDNQCVALGNVVLASHGRTRQEVLPPVPASRRYTPKLSYTGLTHGVPYELKTALREPAVSALIQDPSKADAAISLDEIRADLPPALPLPGQPVWHARRDLLSSSRFARDFVAEIDNGGQVSLRFGDGAAGRTPPPGDIFHGTYPTGQGSAGNVGPQSLRHIVSDDPRITGIRNPMAAVGGADPETLDQVRANAPAAFRDPRRCITEADYATMANTYPGVRSSVAVRQWTGAHAQVTIYAARAAGKPVTHGFAPKLREFLRTSQLIGDELHVLGPRFAPLSAEIAVRVLPGHSTAQVRGNIEAGVAAATGPDS